MAKPTVMGDAAIKHMNDKFFSFSDNIGNKGLISIAYKKMENIATSQGTTSVDFASLNNKKHQGELVNIVNKIFTKVSKPTADNVLSLNKFLLKLPEAGLSKEALEDIYNKYKKIFGKHIAVKTVDASNVKDLEAAMGQTVQNGNQTAITLHKYIKMYAVSFNTGFAKTIEDAQPQETLERKWKQEELDKLKEKNTALAQKFCGLGKFFNKGPIEKNRLEIENLKEEIEVVKWDYEVFKESPGLARSEYREMKQQSKISL
jgi:hypothetical protein